MEGKEERKKEIRMKRKNKIKKGRKSEEQGKLKMNTSEYQCGVDMYHGFLACYFIHECIYIYNAPFVLYKKLESLNGSF
jgi:hypothetical protein